MVTGFAGESPGADTLAVGAAAAAVAVGNDTFVMAQLALDALPTGVATALARLVGPVARAQHRTHTCQEAVKALNMHLS